MIYRGVSKIELKRWTYSIAAIVAVVGQLALMFVPLAEGSEGRSTASHVERSGTSAHFAHSDANCAACQTRTLHGLAARPHVPLPGRIATAAAIALMAEVQSAPGLASHHSRAPPTV